MLKMLGCLLIIVAGAGAGYLQSRKLSMRVQFLEQYITFLSALETEIRYCGDDLPRLLEKHGKDGPSLSFLNRCLKSLYQGSSFLSAWKEAVQKISPDYGLKQEDISAVKDFGTGLGASDVDGQTAHCHMHRELMEHRLESARQEKQKKGRLYFMLGLFLGIGMALLVL